MICELCRNRRASETVGRVAACYWCAGPVRAYLGRLREEVRGANTKVRWMDRMAARSR